MIKYSQGEIIIDLTSQVLTSGSAIEVPELTEYFNNNKNEAGQIDVELAKRKRLIIIIKNTEGEVLEFNMSKISDDRINLSGYIIQTDVDAIYGYELELDIVSKTIEYKYHKYNF